MPHSSITQRAGRMAIALLMLVVTAAGAAAQVRIDTGTVQGRTEQDGKVRAFLGIPYAAPPVGDLRWRAPGPPPKWDGVRDATKFGARCVQARVFDDMVFRDEQSEDCLYLNVWTPASSPDAKLPVMVWIYGGGFQAGSTSEPRQDGQFLAMNGVVVVSMNYRLGVFGFFAHPELTKESPHHASGNYGLLDQVAALEWVKRNIAAFGGDPSNVTIFGESAGSFSVSALMASPLTKGLIAKAIGESGAFFTAGGQTLAPRTLDRAEAAGQEFGAAHQAESLAALRAMPADAVLAAAMQGGQGFRFSPIVDGYLLPEEPVEIFGAGRQNHVPLLAGWNADEVRGGVVLAKERPTARNFSERVQKQFGARAEAVLKLYPATTDAEALESAASLASDTFISYSTWKWLEVHRRTGGAPVYRYRFDRKIPIAPGTKINGVDATAEDIGARHAGEIEYVFGTLDSVKGVTWTDGDRALSKQMMAYWSNFAKTGDPNASGLPDWPRYTLPANQVMHLDVVSKAAPDQQRARYELLDDYTESLRQKPARSTGGN